ncbi:MAG TPA: hypothetical protein VG477_19775 [Thermoanaerobaculia bacterium]|nr:hypothetical protein [Thermoanaerobaculia bacterium]
MKSKPWLWLTALALVPATVVPVMGQPRPVGNELRVSGNTASKQRNPTAAYNAAGTELVVWENDAQGLRARFYGRDGAPLSAEIGLVANQVVSGSPAEGIEVLRKDPVVAFLSSGDFFLAWTEERSSLRVDIFFQDRRLLDRDVYIQKFNSSGAAASAPLRLSEAAGFQSVPRILVRNGADAVVVWQNSSSENDGIFARLIKPTGLPTGAEFKLSSGLAANPAIAGAANGDFIASWEASDGGSQGVFARLYNRAAAPKGAEFRVNTEVPGLQRRAAVAAVTTGGWLAVWQGQGIDNKHHHIFGQFLGDAGNLVGPQFRISEGVGEIQIAPSVAAIAGGNFVVIWTDWKEVFPLGLYGVEIDKLGNSIGDEVQINTRPINAQTRTSLAVSPSGSILAPWEGFHTRTARRAGISARRVEF